MGKIKKTKKEALQDIVNDYIAAGEPWPAPGRVIAAWAIRKKRWEAPHKTLLQQCAEELTEAMRSEMETDPQGRSVHAKRCAKVLEEDENGKLVQKMMWFDTHTRTPKLFNISQQQWRNSILGECKQHRTEEQSFNDNNPEGAEIHHLLDFETDMLDQQHGTDYNPPPNPDEEEDEKED